MADGGRGATVMGWGSCRWGRGWAVIVVADGGWDVTVVGGGVLRQSHDGSRKESKTEGVGSFSVHLGEIFHT